jgi:hypothetical protein
MGGKDPYDKYYHDKQEGQMYSSAKIVMRIIGIVLIIGGIILAVSGIMQQGSVGMGDEGWFEQSSAGSFKIFIAGSMAIFGIFILVISFTRKIAHYQAVEAKPAIITASEGVGTGLARGLHHGGGLPIDINNHGHHRRGSSAPHEVVKVKCRNCGYLDSEDATFCSKCGKRL